jgi:putative (di)nucleoside polyphosphate hydrolase
MIFPYRHGVGIVLINQASQVFLGKRRGFFLKMCWQFPQGGVDLHESEEEAAFRELGEEVGTRNASIICVSKQHLYYDFPKFIQNKYQSKGQKQRWFLMRFQGKDADFNLKATKKPEFSKWKWTDFSYAVASIVSFKKPVYESLYKEFWQYFESNGGVNTR